jgi:hypothetical protein
MPDETKPARPDALANYQEAVINPDKLKNYALNPTSDSGKHKARVFKSVLGFDQSNWELLSQSILAELPYHEATLKEEDQHGKRYTVVLPITGPSGNTADVLTGWIIDPGCDYPRLTTARVLTKKR